MKTKFGCLPKRVYHIICQKDRYCIHNAQLIAPILIFLYFILENIDF